MPEYEFVVRVTCDTEEHAEEVITERLEHDEDYGFDYEIRWW